MQHGNVGLAALAIPLEKSDAVFGRDSDADFLRSVLAEAGAQLIDGADAVRAGLGREAMRVEIRQPLEDAMRRQYPQAGRMHVDEGHHDLVGSGKSRIVVAERERRLVAMMAIG